MFQILHLAQKSPWTKVSLDKSLLGLMSFGQSGPWTTVPWTNVATPPRGEKYGWFSKFSLWGDICNRVVVIVENNVNSAHQSWVYVDLVDNIRKFLEKYSYSCISSSILLKMPLSSPMMTTVLVLSLHSVCPPDTTSCLSRDAAEGVWDLE